MFKVSVALCIYIICIKRDMYFIMKQNFIATCKVSSAKDVNLSIKTN